MVELNVKAVPRESIAPNTDAVRDAVNPLKGLQDVSAGIDKATKVLEDMRRDSVFFGCFDSLFDYFGGLR